VYIKTRQSQIISQMVSLILVVAMLMTTVMPAFAQQRQDNESDHLSLVEKFHGQPQAAIEQVDSLEEFAQNVADMLIFNSDGTVSLRAEVNNERYNEEQRLLLFALVNDVNAKKIGIAIETPAGLVLYGSEKALDQNHAQSVDWWGVHIYLDAWWTGLLNEASGWAVGAVAGLVVAAFCATGVGCIAAALAVTFVWMVVWYVATPYKPQTMTLHAPFPWIDKYAYAQPFNPGMWYHGHWFRVFQMWP
jgi:hypothetical protein